MKLSNHYSRIAAMGKASALGLAVTLSLLCCANRTLGQGIFQVAFDGPPLQPVGTQYGVYQYEELGMSFTPIGSPTPGNQFTRNGGGISIYPEDGTAYLQAALGDSLMFSRTDGSPFGLVSVDLAGYSAVVPDYAVQFVGYRSDGSTVMASFAGSGVTFRTFAFGAQYSDLVSVQIPNVGWSLDNLVVSVPEPSILAFGVPGFLVALARRRKKRIGPKNGVREKR